METSIKPYAEMTDLELVELVTGGDHEAVAHLLIDRCGGGLKYMMQTKFKAAGLQFEEAVSELFLHLQRHDWKALRDFRGRDAGGRSCKLIHYILFGASGFVGGFAIG